MSRASLRHTLLGGLLLLTALALATAGVTSIVALQGYLLTRVDDQLRAATAFAQQRIGEVHSFAEQGGMLQAIVAPSDYIVEIRRDDGTLLRLAGLPALPASSLLALAPAPPDDGRLSAARTVSGGRYRVMTVRSAGNTVLVGLPLASVHQTVRRMVLVEVGAGAVVLLLLGGFARLLVARTIRPLDRIAATAAAIADGELDRRVTVDGPPGRSEVRRLTVAVNGMLTRIEAAMGARSRSEERLRRFVADASHELRTPLTSIRGYLQLLRQGIVDAAQRPDALRRVDEEATRMSKIVDDLLYLARLDAEPALSHDPVDLAVLARDSLSDMLAAQPGRPAALEVPESCPVPGDEDALRQVLANLLANVRAHTPPGTPVRVTLSRVDGRATVEVADDGPGMTAELAARACDRFTRGDAGRGSGGSGLGLAIVAEIVAAHGGTMAVRSSPAEGTAVTFTVPAAAP